MAEPARRRATYADLEAVPSHLVAEIIDGQLVTHPRPAARHGRTAFKLGGKLSPHYDANEDDPDGWQFIPEPELHFGSQVVVPDLAGWRRLRMPMVPGTASLTLSPDWVCEVSSPSTASYDRGAKRRIYAQAGVASIWIVDGAIRMVEAYVAEKGQWVLAGTAGRGETVCLPPFDAISFPADDLFPFGEQ